MNTPDWLGPVTDYLKEGRFDDAAKALRERYESPWIRVEDALPIGDEIVIAFGRFSWWGSFDWETAQYNGYLHGRDYWTDSESVRFEIVTHWMPMPETPPLGPEHESRPPSTWSDASTATPLSDMRAMQDRMRELANGAWPSEVDVEETVQDGPYAGLRRIRRVPIEDVMPGMNIISPDGST